MLSPEAILNLQRHVGNTVVTTLIELASASARGPKRLNAALAKLPSQWRDLTSSDVVVPDLFRIIEVDRPGVSHEHLIGATINVKVGALADALTASLNPMGDRGQAFNP